ncbi:MAG: TIGR01212 family radical SAM protein [Omnitrophica bacterium]|nr:TIGR01212 family radical SAM protein [Candidatus Omnitrophota bacterium]
METPYYSFNRYLREKFGTKVRKISLNAGFTCPNRDGTFSAEGCTFCNERGFSHSAKTTVPLRDQIKTGIDFSRKRFKTGKFIAYFQNAANTSKNVDELKKAYDAIKDFPEIVGLAIATRPDCIDRGKLDLIESYADRYDVWIEYGVESVNDHTLRKINRSHTFSQTLKAIEETRKRKIKIGAHIILGLPDESEKDMMKTAKTMAGLPIDGVKLHVLHVLRNTKLEEAFNKGEVRLTEPAEYVNLACNFLERLNPKCVILRLVSDARREVLIAPKWINDKLNIIKAIENEFQKRASRQGRFYEEKKSMCIR